MNKKLIIGSAVVTALLNLNLNANTLENKIFKLEQQIKALKQEVASAEDVEELDERLEEVETATLTDKVQFGLGMRVEMNNVDTTYANGTSPKNEEAVYRTKFYLNMKSKIADNLKFTGRLSSYKNWGDSNTDQMAMASMDPRQGRTPDNHSELYVERAYLDWIITNGKIPVTLTMGRQPSSDGPSFQIKEGTERKGTYDALAFDGAADGVVLTTNLSKVTPGGTALRVNYAKPNYSDYNTDMKDTKVVGFFLDKTCQKIEKKHLIQIYYVKATELNANPTFVDMNASHSTFMQSMGDKNIGDFDIYGAMFEVQGVNKFDFFVHYSHSIAKPNGNTVDLSSMGGSATSGLLTSTAGDKSEKTANAIWTGVRYNMSDIAIGAEYNKGSKNWFSATYAPNYPLNKLATRGTATEVYLSKKVNKYANIRVGYVDIKYDYTGSGVHLGAPMKITNALGTNAEKETKNLYIHFSVLF
jgi:hypothetical protein